MPLRHCSIIYKPILCLIFVSYLKEITGLQHLKYVQQLTFFCWLINTHAATVYPNRLFQASQKISFTDYIDRKISTDSTLAHTRLFIWNVHVKVMADQEIISCQLSCTIFDESWM